MPKNNQWLFIGNVGWVERSETRQCESQEARHPMRLAALSRSDAPRPILRGRLVEHVADARREIVERDRLLNEVDAAVDAALVDHGIARIAGHEQHLEAGPE